MVHHDSCASLPVTKRQVLPPTYRAKEWDVIFGAGNDFDLRWDGNRHFVQSMRTVLSLAADNVNVNPNLIQSNILLAVKGNGGQFLLITSEGRLEVLDEASLACFVTKFLSELLQQLQKHQRDGEQQRRNQDQQQLQTQQQQCDQDQQQAQSETNSTCSNTTSPSLDSAKHSPICSSPVAKLLTKNHPTTTERDVIFGPGGTFDKEWPGNKQFLGQIRTFRKVGASEDDAATFVSKICQQVEERGSRFLLLTAEGSLRLAPKRLFQTAFVTKLHAQLVEKHQATSARPTQDCKKTEVVPLQSTLKEPTAETRSTPNGPQSGYFMPEKAAMPRNIGAATHASSKAGQTVCTVKSLVSPDETGSTEQHGIKADNTETGIKKSTCSKAESGECSQDIRKSAQATVYPPCFDKDLAKAEDGDIDAQFRVGLQWKQGGVVASDFESAARWLTKAAHRGHAAAQFELSKCFTHGHGVESNNEEALRWLKSAARKHRLDKAQNLLGQCHEKGLLDLERDISWAADYYILAAKQGLREAKENLRLLAPKLMEAADDCRNLKAERILRECNMLGVCNWAPKKRQRKPRIGMRNYVMESSKCSERDDSDDPPVASSESSEEEDGELCDSDYGDDGDCVSADSSTSEQQKNTKSPGCSGEHSKAGATPVYSLVDQRQPYHQRGENTDPQNEQDEDMKMQEGTCSPPAKNTNVAQQVQDDRHNSHCHETDTSHEADTSNSTDKQVRSDHETQETLNSVSSKKRKAGATFVKEEPPLEAPRQEPPRKRCQAVSIKGKKEQKKRQRGGTRELTSAERARRKGLHIW